MSVGQKQARTHLDRSVVEEHRVWRGKGPARAEATKPKDYRCSRLTVRYCSETYVGNIMFFVSIIFRTYSFLNNSGGSGGST